ncbi:MAG: transporter [Caulobacteraceae bacterium]|nr:transporter [Caulobacteraceae bacterium]
MSVDEHSSAANQRTSIALCFLVAAIEGFDIQAIGVAAPKLGAELKLAKDVLGQALAATNIGLVLGAAVGGWLADRIGRKLTLILAVTIFGAFTLLTMVSNSFEVLFAARLGAGIGFGLALPNIMALAAELAPQGRRGVVGTIMFCGMPCGGGTVALLSWLAASHINWRQLFLIGGVGPLLIAALVWLLMKEQPRPAQPAAQRLSWKWLGLILVYLVFLGVMEGLGKLPGAGSIAKSAPWLATVPTVVTAFVIAHREVLLGGGRKATSILLWLTFAPTLVILYLVLNWLPTLIVGKGFPAAASEASVYFNYASVIGAVTLGMAYDRFGLRWPMVIAYLGVMASLFGLAHATGHDALMALSGALGFFLLGANYALYGAAAGYYAKAVRGRGSGAAVAWGRAGAVAGPLIGGFLLQGGSSAGGVVMAMMPYAVIALVGVVLLSMVAKPAE